MVRAWVVVLLALAACATQYQRRMSPAEDPANPEAAATPVEGPAVTAYGGGPDGGSR